MCEHCKGSHLRGMADVSDVKNLFRFADGVVAAGGESILVSGGCDVRGGVPLMKHIDAIRYASGTGLKVNVHAGFVSREDAERLVGAGVSAFSVDVHQDEAVIRNILHLDVGASAYAELLDNVIAAGGRPVPHLTVGFGTYDLTASAELVKSKGIRDVILLALVPTEGTATEDTLLEEDAISSAAALLAEMGMNVALGCMRPRACRGLEVKCIEAGVRKIANPSAGTLAWARDNGFTIIEERTCCCFTPRRG
jgi:hypothetical protein